ncbi:MAG: hypothetical protein DMF85_13305 [Acidobacteria bacterium]|nr:MAG: hypothetical protein DMF85_13305 [Acidobacteriota bacterium]
MRAVPPGVSDQGRHPGDADRRSDHRALKILLLRLRLIGDVVFTTPLLGALKRAYPGARLTFLVERDAAPVVINNPHLNEVIVVPRSRGARRLFDDLALARRLRAERFDVALDLHGGPRSAWLTWASGARERIGYAIPGREWMYTRVVKRPRELRARHSVANQWDLVEAMPGWPGGVPRADRDAVEMPLSAGNRFRRWPEQSFVELVTTLARRDPRRRVTVSSGPSDRAAAARIVSAARATLGGDATRVIDLGEFDLQELRALIGRSRLFVGGDTGPLHIAATTGTAIVGIYGPTLSAQSAPWRDPRLPTESVELTALPCRPCDQRVCTPGDFRCLTTLSSETVIAAAERALTAR